MAGTGIHYLVLERKFPQDLRLEALWPRILPFQVLVDLALESSPVLQGNRDSHETTTIIQSVCVYARFFLDTKG
ncbi:hypothetical protein A3L10_04755 [Thermococcus radiotolerans]|uniref:Uncharacterized protein n=1 Tax=Thermococcus radiotolerans TaxID=187880 RepID=A0A2Z2MYP9_9EURY|nr:hypothetical protein A3L10_04755 [Thermococcus radiotolerans]